MTVCVVTLALGGWSRATRGCEQVRSARATIVGRWGDEADAPAAEKYLRSAGATPVTRMLGETLREALPPKPADPKAEPRTPKRFAPAGVRAQEKATKTT